MHPIDWGGGGNNLVEHVHGFVVKSGFDQDGRFFVKSGSIDDTKMVFDGSVVKSAITWTTIIGGYVKSGRSDVSLKFFSEMRETDIVLDRYLLLSALSACSMLEFVGVGSRFMIMC